MARLVSRGVMKGLARIKTPLALPGQRIGIMGGSFNPPHEGHRIVAETALKRLSLDQIWWLVTPGNPLKENSSLPAQRQRMADVARLARGPRMKVTGFEAALGSPFTAATLSWLRARFPGVQFVWVMGADNLAGFDRWQHWHTIVRSVPIAVVDRPGYRLAALASRMAHRYAFARLDESKARALAGRTPPAWTFLTTRLSPLSSTQLRQARENAKTTN